MKKLETTTDPSVEKGFLFNLEKEDFKGREIGNLLQNPVFLTDPFVFEVCPDKINR